MNDDWRGGVSMTREQRPGHDPARTGKALADASRNERQKSILLAEVGKVRRQEVAAVIETSKSIVAVSRKLCESKQHSRGKRRQPS